ncbi:MAG: tetratricopeptide repeat protein, partial [Saprospiraceae bacterium]|nr:tetratricopeptide repeat protein [Saprospiraceae bacterium]
PWCGPCRVLGPTIEQLATESKGAWELVKINTEEDQELAYQYGIRSIPNVKMFYKGEVVAEFAGALPRQQIVQWLDENLPSADKQEWSDMQESLKKLSSKDGVNALSDFLVQHPGHPEASLHLARLQALTDPVAAKAIVADIKMGDPAYEVVEDIGSLSELATLTDTNHGGLTQELQLASIDLTADQIEQAVQRIIEVVKKDKSIHNDLPRRAGIAIFRLLGGQHPITKKYRRLFDMVLY